MEQRAPGTKTKRRRPEPVTVERRQQPRAPLVYSELFPSVTASIEPVLERALGKLGELGCLNGSHPEIDLALHEALINAIKHGNRGSRRKRVELRCFQLHDGGILLVVRDEGQGFDPSEIPDPTRPENRLRASGRGILLIRSFMDEVRFERGGSEIRMKKKT